MGGAAGGNHPGWMAGCHLDGSGKHTHIQDRPTMGQDDPTRNKMRRGTPREKAFAAREWDSHKHIKAASAAFFQLGH